ncbi:MAG: endonuclease YncB(thermonuclease family) [Candidatus Azotimanducaceae bacterium]|jgi:endonuclease YncB( thermonuclease family)
MRLLFTLLCLFSLGEMPSGCSTLRAANQVAGAWEVMEGCRLVSSPINDGDSFSVKYGDEQYTFRLYFVDALETSETYIDRVREQARYFAIPEGAVTDGGQLATQFTKNFLRGEFTVITKWEDARGSSTHKRYFALIQKQDKFLATELMLAGLARLYGKPTEDRWPSGVTPRTFLNRLKNNEREAQREKHGIWALAAGSLQMSGLEALSAATVATEPSEIATTNSGAFPIKDRINLNTATREELQTLPGIGPALSARMIGARPIKSVESLVEVPGITGNTLAGFSHMIITEDPPPPPFTVVFYKADLDTHLDTQVTVRVAAVAKSDAESPESFRPVLLQTAYQGKDGGQITAYIPDEFYESFINYYNEPGREFTGLLYSREGQVVMVYIRK